MIALVAALCMMGATQAVAQDVKKANAPAQTCCKKDPAQTCCKKDPAQTCCKQTEKKCDKAKACCKKAAAQKCCKKAATKK